MAGAVHLICGSIGMVGLMIIPIHTSKVGFTLLYIAPQGRISLVAKQTHHSQMVNVRYLQNRHKSSHRVE